jgi:hypothetical protein
LNIVNTYTFTFYENIEQLDNILDNLISYESWAAQKDFIKFFENSKKILKSNDLYMFS